MQADEAQTFMAASWLRTFLGHPSTSALDDALVCYGLIVGEVYHVLESGHSLGGARTSPSEDGPNVFVTHECARSLGYLARVFENTGEFLKLVDEYNRYVRELLHQEQLFFDHDIERTWLESELTRVRESLVTTTQERDGSIFFRIDFSKFPAGHSSREFIGWFMTEVQLKTVELTNSLLNGAAKAKRIIKDNFQPRRERPSGVWNEKLRGHLAAKIVQKSLEEIAKYAQSLEAHAASLALTTQDQTDDAETSLCDGNLTEWADKLLHPLAKAVRTHLGVVGQWMESELHRLSYEVRVLGRVAKLTDLVFAANCCGYLRGDWSDPIFERVAVDAGQSRRGIRHTADWDAVRCAGAGSPAECHRRARASCLRATCGALRELSTAS